MVVFPTFEEVLEFGTEAEKKDARKQMSFWSDWKISILKSIDQLPELEGDNLVFVVEERKHKRQQFLFIMNNEKEVWKEPLIYEYYERFIEIGKMLKEKYGHRMKDFVPPEYQGWLLGNRISATERIMKFRESLK